MTAVLAERADGGAARPGASAIPNLASLAVIAALVIAPLLGARP
jgi:hypothetical protein